MRNSGLVVELYISHRNAVSNQLTSSRSNQFIARRLYYILRYLGKQSKCLVNQVRWNQLQRQGYVRPCAFDHLLIVLNSGTQ